MLKLFINALCCLFWRTSMNIDHLSLRGVSRRKSFRTTDIAHFVHIFPSARHSKAVSPVYGVRWWFLPLSQKYEPAPLRTLFLLQADHLNARWHQITSFNRVAAFYLLIKFGEKISQEYAVSNNLKPNQKASARIWGRFTKSNTSMNNASISTDEERWQGSPGSTCMHRYPPLDLTTVTISVISDNWLSEKNKPFGKLQWNRH